MFLENYASITRNENKGLDAYAKQHALHSVKKRSKRNLHETLLMLTRPPNVEKNRFFKILEGSCIKIKVTHSAQRGAQKNLCNSMRSLVVAPFRRD